MDDTVTKVIIAAVSAIAGAIAKEIAPELKPLLFGKARVNSDLTGNWKAIWVVGEDNKEIKDRVELFRVWGEQVWAKGINSDYGDYRISGRVSKSYVVTLKYEGVERRQPLGGVVIMKLSSMRNEMKGFWYEYGRRERIVGGPTTWTKEAS
jgi:hypothetical protein